MGGRGASSSIASRVSSNSISVGLNSYDYFDQDMDDMTDYFEKVIRNVDPNLEEGFWKYTSGVFGGAKKTALDEQYGLSEFIESDESKPLRVDNNPILYRGGTISEEQFNNLKVGDTLDVMSSKDKLTSWTDREMVAHMYADESKDLYGQGGNHPKDIIVVDTTRTNDAVVNPYTHPQHEVLRSKNMSYTITKIVDASEYTKPIGRDREYNPYDDYLSPVTYIYVKSNKKR